MMIPTRPLVELREYREGQTPRLSQQGLAEKLGVTSAAVSRWESGARFPERRYLPKISKLTGVSLMELLSD